jgi:hypothetical protein
MEMMPGGIIFLRRMALETNAVAFGPDLLAMRVMTIAASHSSMEHPALNE